MRQGRVKEEGRAAVYHCVTRTVAGEMLLDLRCKEVLRKMLWQVAGFCGVEVLAYCIMTNHFHVLVRVPEPRVLEQKELIRRYRILYGEGRAAYLPDPEVMAAILSDSDTEDARQWEARLLRRMSDVSEFMKTLKQRFSVWYNRKHGRYGTLWAERFKSVLVEDDPAALKTVAAYIDLNSVRAGLVKDPADYRWSSFGEAMGGVRRAQCGLAQVLGEDEWSEAADEYRVVLYGKGAVGRQDAGVIPHEKALEVLAKGGKLSRATLLRCRVRYFSDGAVLGSQAFVAGVADRLGQGPLKRRRKHRTDDLPMVEDRLVTYRALRKDPVT